MSTSSNTRLHFEGVLDKAGKRFFEGFRKRWFTLDGQYLTYYKAAEKTEENYLGTIDFSQVKAVNQTKTASNGFQITTKSRTYTFSAPSPDQLTEWISVLRQAMQLKSFEQRKNRLSSEVSFDSQYEEISGPARSRSLCSDRSVDDGSTADNLYSSVVDPKTLQSFGEYSVVGVPSARDSSDAGAAYDLVGSRPPSKSAPPTYEMVQAVNKGTLENGEDLYDLVTEPHGKRNRKDTGPIKQKDISPQTETEANVNLVDNSAEPVLYSTVPKGSRKQNNSFRELSMISEGDKEEAEEEEASLPSPEEDGPPLPPRMTLEEGFAIYEIKRLLEDTAKDEGEKDTSDKQDDLVPAETGSAFQKLKAFLQKLDSTDEGDLEEAEQQE